MVIFRLYFRVIVKQNNDPEIESKYHYYNLSCFIQITCILSRASRTYLHMAVLIGGGNLTKSETKNV